MTPSLVDPHSNFYLIKQKRILRIKSMGKIKLRCNNAMHVNQVYMTKKLSVFFPFTEEFCSWDEQQCKTFIEHNSTSSEPNTYLQETQQNTPRNSPIKKHNVNLEHSLSN